ncbi:hypothetical protein AX15_005948 [Amanita polypyramis BW_CC]|nr:hypothetical protein AX15_005948 [Amanita polypyramis BW_CC]
MSTPSSPPPVTTDAPSFSGQPPPTPTGSSNGGSLATSATLYLYTFLATLVLLLIVSAAIVVRSFILRRRHRRAIEEAIRNGTLPTVLAAGFGHRPRVDLSKKPRLWDAWIEKHEQPVSGQRRAREWYWDMIKPFSAVYVVPSAAGAGSDDHASSSRNDSSTSRQTTLRVRMGTAARHAGRAIAYYVSTRSSMNSPRSSSHPSSSQVALSTDLCRLDSGNATVRVAVLVAMPRRPSTKELPPGLRSTASSLSPSSQAFSPVIEQSGEDDEQLPQLEMGVTEIRVVPNADDIAPEGKRSMTTE